jgi:hypothetical protein
MSNSGKILLALQYWDQDKQLGMKLARLIADMEDRHSDKADFLFMSRFDCTHDTNTEKYVNRKFNTYSVTNRRRASGWPHGCNDLWFGVMDWIYIMREAKKIPQYDAVFTFEADGAPLLPNWITVLRHAWDTAQMEKRTYVYGAFLQYPAPHINGNGLFSCDPKFTYWLAREKVAASPHKGWDYELAPDFARWGWGNCPCIKSYWRTETFGEEQFVNEVNQGVAWLHGIKDDSLIDICRKRYNLPPDRP